MHGKRVTREEHRKIRTLLKLGMSQRLVSHELGISEATVTRLKNVKLPPASRDEPDPNDQPPGYPFFDSQAKRCKTCRVLAILNPAGECWACVLRAKMAAQRNQPAPAISEPQLTGGVLVW